MKTIFKLDLNGDYVISIAYQLNEQFTLSLSVRNNANIEFLKTINKQFELHINDNKFIFHEIKSTNNDNYVFQQDFSRVSLASPFHIKIYINEKLVFYRIINHGSTKDVVSNPFSVSQTRLLAIRYFRDHAIRPPKIAKKNLLLTDLHTHYDAVLLPSELLAIALKNNLLIQTNALKSILSGKKLSIPEFKDKTIAFPDLKEKHPSIYRYFSHSLSIPSGKIIPFGELEEIYACRDILTDSLILFSDILIKIAEKCKAQGIRYIELSLNNILKDDWLTTAEKTIQTIQKTYNVTVRFLAAIYNYNEDSQIRADIKRIQQKSFSPYIVGVDFSGHEQYNFYEKNIIIYMEFLAEWISKYNPGFIMRVHAGENSLHIENIATVLQIAKKFRIYIRIGHAIYGWNDFNLALSKKLRDYVIIELNPDSNLALNNIHKFAQLPIKQFSQNKIPFVLGTDGAGFYRTDSKQTLISAEEGGATDETIQLVNETEMRYINFQKKQFTRKLQQFILRERLAKIICLEPNQIYPLHHDVSIKTQTNIFLPQEQNKKPIYLVSNVRIAAVNFSRLYLEKIIYTLYQLVFIIDPNKAYFLVNSAKAELTTILKFIIELYNSHTTGPKHEIVYAVTTEQKSIGINKKLVISHSLTDFPMKIIQFLKEMNGTMFIFSGDAITNDIILHALNSAMLFFVLTEGTIQGAYKTASQFRNIHFNQILKIFYEQYYSLLQSAYHSSISLPHPLFTKSLIAKMLIEYGDQDYRTLDGWRSRQELWRLADQAIEPTKNLLVEMGYPNVSSQVEETKTLCGHLLYNSAEWHYKKGHYDLAKQMLIDAEKVCQTITESQSILALIADIYMAYGRLYTWQANTYRECIAYLGKAYIIMQAIYGKNAEKTLRALGAMAVGHNKFGKPEQAIKIFQSLLSNPELIKNDWQQAGYNSNLAEIFLKQNQFEKVDFHAQQAGKVYSHHNHPQKYCFFNTLGFAYLKEKNSKKSQEYFQLTTKDYEDNPTNSSAFPIHIAEAYYGLMLINTYHTRHVIIARKNLNQCRDIIKENKLDISTHRNFVNFQNDEDLLKELYEKKLSYRSHL